MKANDGMEGKGKKPRRWSLDRNPQHQDGIMDAGETEANDGIAGDASDEQDASNADATSPASSGEANATDPTASNESDADDAGNPKASDDAGNEKAAGDADADNAPNASDSGASDEGNDGNAKKHVEQDAGSGNQKKSVEPDAGNADTDERTDDGDAKASFRDVLKANRAFLIVFTVILVVALAAIPAWFLKIRYVVDAPKTSVRYSVERYGHSWEKTALPDKMKDYKVNTDQYVQKDPNGNDMHCFGFKPGDANGNKAPAAAHTMKAVLAFGDAKSRNFIMQDMSPIQMGIKSGYINMEFCFVQTDNEYSVLAVEALAESDYTDPSHTWDVINDLMLTPTSDLDNRDERIDAIMSVLSKTGVSNEKGKTPINKESIEQGSFYLFGYTMSEAQRADYIPALFVDGTVKNADLSIYNPDDVWKYIKALPDMSHV